MCLQNNMRGHYNIKRALTSLCVVVGFGMIASCGNNRQAKAVVNDFLEENLNTQDYDKIGRAHV